MTTRVIGPNEVFLNDTFFPIVGKVRSSIASNYPEKRITGDFGKDSQRRVSVQTWDDARGGTGIDRWSLEHNDRSLMTSLDIRHKGHLILRGELTTAGTITDGIPLIGELGSNIISANGTDVQELTSNTTWTSRRTLDAAPTDVMNGNIGGTEFLIFAIGTGYEYSSSAATWNQSVKDAVNIAFWNERLWGIDAVGQLWFTFTVGSAEVDDAQLLLANGEVVTGLFRARDHSAAFILYAVTSRGLYAHDDGNRKFVQVEGIELPDNNVVTHERPANVWKERIYLAAGRSLKEYDPIAASIRDVGFDLDDGMPVNEDGLISSIISSPTELFVGTFPVDSTDDGVIMAWNARGWRRVHRVTTGNIESMHMTTKSVSGISSPAGPHLWYGNGPSSFSVVRTLQNVSSALTLNIVGFDYRASASTTTVLEQHQFPWFDAGQRDVTKVALRVKVEVEGADSSTAVEVFFAIDGAVGLTKLTDTFTNDSTFNAGNDRIQGNGITTFSFPSIATPEGTAFRSIRFALGLVGSGGANNSPDVLSVTLEYLKILDEKLAFDFEIDFSQDHDGKSPEQLRASYATARALKTLPEFTYRDDTGNRNYYVKVFADQGEEESGHEERGTELVHCEQI